MDPRVREGFARLAPLGLSFDAWMYHTQLGDLVDLAHAFHETQIVLDPISAVRSVRSRLRVASKRMSDAEHDDFGDGDGLDEQEGTIGAEDAQRALGLAPPVERQCTGDDFDEPEIFVRSRRKEGCVPPPGRHDNGESADECGALEYAVPGRSPNEY